MSLIPLLAAALAAVALLLIPKRWTTLAFLAACCYLGMSPFVELGSFTFSLMRVCILVGLLRAILMGPRIPGGFCGIDAAMIMWGMWAIASSVFHSDPRADVVTKLGQVFDAWGAYFLLRRFIAELRGPQDLARSLALLLVPLAIGMSLEYITGSNVVFGELGGRQSVPLVRNGRIRCFGPFLHPILAGTAAASTVPVLLSVSKIQPIIMLTGLSCVLVVIFTTGSSGPIMTVVLGIAALGLWPLRKRLAAVRWTGVALYVALDIVMKAPAYYLMARIDLTGSSTGWHRARLLESAIEHLDEWWKTGTDYTRHWMPTGVSWSPDHSDITNHLLHYGVIGGLPLIFLFVAVLWQAFRTLGTQLRLVRAVDSANEFAVWSIGSTLFAHCVTFFSIRYFDQSFLFVLLVLAFAATWRTTELWIHHVSSRANGLSGPGETQNNEVAHSQQRRRNSEYWGEREVDELTETAMSNPGAEKDNNPWWPGCEGTEHGRSSHAPESTQPNTITTEKVPTTLL